MGEIISGELSPSDKMNHKELVVSHVKGKVKWFNVELGYGFINRDDTNDDIFVHHTAIAKYNTRHQLSSLAESEPVEFDVVRGQKGLEASNVTGPNGEQVKGSHFASNLYAGRFRFRRSRNYGRGGGGRFYSRRRYEDRSSKEPNENSEVKNGGDDVKRDKTDGAISHEQRPKNYSRARKPFLGGGPMVGGDHQDRGHYGGLRRSNSLPSDLNRYQTGSFQQGRRRRRRGPPRGSDGRPLFRPPFFGRRPRTSRTSRISEKEYTLDKDGKKVLEGESVEPRGDSLKSEKEKSTEEHKGSTRGKLGRRRQVSEGKSEKTEPTTNEKSDKSQQSQGRKPVRRRGNRTKKNSEPAGGKVESSKTIESADEDRHATEDSGSGNKDKGQRHRSGRWRRGKRSGRGGARSSSVEVSTQTPSTRGEESVKSEKELPGGNGDGAVVVSGVGPVVAVPKPEPVVGEA